jgi:energy-coupling factor transport system substrate-specific component
MDGGAGVSWVLASFTLLGAALVIGFAWYERTHPSARVLALIATLAALAALGRVAFAPIPSVKPTTDIVLIAGYVLGGAPGFVVGAVAALTSNVFFGQGPWTPWQMIAWGGVGAGGALLARVAGRELGRASLTVACAVAGLAYGAVMNFSLWVTFAGDHTLDKLTGYYVTSLPFDIAHAVGNAMFCLAFGPALVRALRRFRARFEVTWRPAPAVAATMVALLLAFPVAATADAPAQSLRWLERAQNSDGGFGGTPDQSSTQLFTGWAGLGLAAAGRNPRDVQRSGKSVVDYVVAHAGELDDLGELNRTILLLKSSGTLPRRVAGRDLVAEVASKQRKDGSFAGRVNTTSFAILGLAAAGRSPKDPVLRRAARWVAGQANDDGGFNFDGKGAPSGIDDTGAAVQALAAAGRRNTTTVRRALSFIVRRQNDDGGFPLQPGGGSNAQSTAWAVQALIAGRRDPEKVTHNGSRTPTAYLRSLIGSNGAVRYSRTSTQTPVWVTAQALAALTGKPFPLASVPRAKRRRAAAKAAPAATRTPAPTRTPTPKPKPTPDPAHTMYTPAVPPVSGAQLGLPIAPPF